jgi:peptidoglycan/xylan/chitin deacetylase (PgdA/CDA1 family)
MSESLLIADDGDSLVRKSAKFVDEGLFSSRRPPEQRDIFRGLNEVLPQPPSEIVRSNSIASASTFETAMFLDAQSQEDEILKAELKNLEKEFEEQSARLMSTESRVGELRDQLLQVQAERDGLKEIHEDCQGEVEALRRQCETVVGLDMSLKAAISEIDRLRRVNLTDNKAQRDMEIEESRLKVQALNLEVVRLNNDLEIERRDNERIRIEMEKELETMVKKLGDDMRSVFEQQFMEANQEIDRLRKCVHDQALTQESEIVAKENAENLRSELLQLQFDFSQVQESLEGTRAENVRIREEANEAIGRLTAELKHIIDERNSLEIDLSTSVDEQNRLRFSIKEDGKVPREEVSKAVAHAVESRDQQIKELRQQLTQVNLEVKKIAEDRNWLSARLKVSKEEASLLQRQVVEQQMSSDHDLHEAHAGRSNALAESNRLRTMLDAGSNENQGMKAELSTLQHKVESLRQSHAQKEANVSMLQQSLSEMEDKLLACEKERDFLQKQLHPERENILALNQPSRLGHDQQMPLVGSNDNESISEMGPTTERIAYVDNGGMVEIQSVIESTERIDEYLSGSLGDASTKELVESVKSDVQVSGGGGDRDLQGSVGEFAISTTECNGAIEDNPEKITTEPPTGTTTGEDNSKLDTESVDTPKTRGGPVSRTLDSFEEHVHAWPRSWHDNDGRTKYGGRDSVGYGPTPPKPLWPNMAKVALNFVIHFDECSETYLLHGDSTGETQMTACPLEGQGDEKVESIYDYGSRAGFWRLHRLFTAKELPCTVFAVGRAMERNPDACHAMKGAGWEIASHCYRHIDYRNVDEKTQVEHIKRTISIHKKLTGNAPAGIYVGSPSSKTRSIVSRSFYYDSDSYADELPYWTIEEGKPHLVIPYTLTLNDESFATADGFSTAQEFSEFLIETLE